MTKSRTNVALNIAFRVFPALFGLYLLIGCDVSMNPFSSETPCTSGAHWGTAVGLMGPQNACLGSDGQVLPDKCCGSR